MTKDTEVFQHIEKEYSRQNLGLEMIASENYTSKAVLQAAGSILTNKYAEGYPKKRYYGGCEHVDSIEQLAIDRALKLFEADFVNVQPHSGSSANLATYFALAQTGDTLLGLDLSHGGHLTHGSPVNFSGFLFESKSHRLNPDTHLICYESLYKMADEVRPKIIIAGYSSYPRQLDYQKYKQIAQAVGAYLVVDMSHFSGLVAGKVLENPLPYADVVTTTTHKTLRGPRGGLILSSKKEQFGKKLNSKIFPGFQGGPLEHIIAAKAICFYEALQKDFEIYAQNVVKNAKALAEVFSQEGIELITGGTDNHLLLVDLRRLNITGKTAQALLEEAGITVNKNTLPGETESPFVTSGIRLGSPALTTRGMAEKQMHSIALWICEVLKNPTDEAKRAQIKAEVGSLCQRFPLDKLYS